MSIYPLYTIDLKEHSGYVAVSLWGGSLSGFLCRGGTFLGVTLGEKPPLGLELQDTRRSHEGHSKKESISLVPHGQSSL